MNKGVKICSRCGYSYTESFFEDDESYCPCCGIPDTFIEPHMGIWQLRRFLLWQFLYPESIMFYDTENKPENWPYVLPEYLKNIPNEEYRAEALEAWEKWKKRHDAYLASLK